MSNIRWLTPVWLAAILAVRCFAQQTPVERRLAVAEENLRALRMSIAPAVICCQRPANRPGPRR